MATEITLIDCNRLNSVEFNGGNKSSKALWNNLVGSGLKVEPGDTVSVHNSFISETGSTSGIEFNDTFLETRSITYTKLTPALYLENSSSKYNTADFINKKPLGYERVTASNVTESVQVRQNECNILYNYYKTSNGENYFNLPRRFCMKNACAISSWAGLDNEDEGKAYQNVALISSVGASFLPDSTEQMFHVNADYFWFQNGRSPVRTAPPGPSNASYNFLKMRNDNSRFKIFVNVDTRYGEQSDAYPEMPENEKLIAYNKWSPAYYEYLEYIENLKISIPRGFSSEQAIAQTITNKLKTVSQPKVNKYISLSASAIPQITADKLSKDLALSLELNTNTYKTFWANGLRLSNSSIWTEWNGCVRYNTEINLGAGDNPPSNDYLSGFQYIGVKRPELFLRGRDFCKTYGSANLNNAVISLGQDLKQDNFLNSALWTNNGSNHVIKTGMKWDDIEKQRSISKIFNEQGNHPELFENRFNQYYNFTNENNSRFLHMNILCNASRNGSGHMTENIIGWDYMTTGAGALSASNFGVENLNTAPLFIDYNPKYKDIVTDGNSWEEGYRFGFLKKYIADGSVAGITNGSAYCSFSTAHFGIGNGSTEIDNNYTSIPRPYFFLNTSDTVEETQEEDFSVASGTNTTVLAGFNSNLFLNGVSGSILPVQISGGAGVASSGLGTGAYSGFLSNAVPLATPKYFHFTGSNFRFLRTRDISTILSSAVSVRISWIKGNSNNGGETADLNENLDMVIENVALGTVSTTNIALGGGTPYPDNVFTTTTINLSAADRATGAHIKFIQTASSQSNFDVYGIKNILITYGDQPIIRVDTYLGWDVHFNAYGNQCIGLLDGYLEQNWDGTSFNKMNKTLYNASTYDSIENFKYVNKIYLGANNPSLEFDTDSGRFQLTDLHTSEKVQNKFNAGGIVGDADADPVVLPTEVAESPNAGTDVYKVNKRLFDNNFTPTMMPYSVNNSSIRLLNNQGGAKRTIGGVTVYNLNPNFEGWNIYDQLCGIIIKDFGYSSSTWGDGIWGILGFTYEAFNSVRDSTNDLTTRIGTDNKENLPYALTNAEVSSKQVLDFATNVWGTGKYTLQVPITQQFHTLITAAAGGAGSTEPTQRWLTQNQFLNAYPAITEAATSIKLVAKNLPKKIKNGYYIVRSDILDGTTYSGGESGQKYPIVAVVDKNNFNSDFFVGGESSLSFTFNKTQTITKIRTSIHQPNQTLSDVDSSSAIIYKITRRVPENYDIVSQILNEGKKTKK